MPFGRKKKKKLIISVFNFIKIFFAFSRTKKYISLSIKRIKGTPQALSLGLATGIAISFTPFIGLHALLAIFISWVVGGSMAAALIGTLFGNPWTFPFIWYLTFEIGQFINYGFLSYEEEFSFKTIIPPNHNTPAIDDIPKNSLNGLARFFLFKTLFENL